MMTVSQADEILRKIKYKPGYFLSWEEVGRFLIKVWWSFERPDCYDPDVMGVGQSGPLYVYLADIDNTEQLVRMVFGMTTRLEEHEAREFFLYDDLRVFDPHMKLIQEAF